MCKYYLRGYLLTERITVLMRNTVDLADSVAFSEVYDDKKLHLPRSFVYGAKHRTAGLI
jgi:hypothetical protein